MRKVYLDSAATTLIKPDAVSRAVYKAVRTLSSPGRGGYPSAMEAAETAYKCRERCAKLFNVPDADSVVFTVNATHALNIAIRTLVRPGARVIVSGFEHNSVMRPLNMLGADIRIARFAPFDAKGAKEAFAAYLASGADAVVMNHVSNVFGSVLPVYDIAKMCRSAGVPVIVDASQSAGNRAVDFSLLGADFIAMPGHKGLYGPQGTGILLCARPPEPLIAGGTGSTSREYAMPPFLPDIAEAGTHNMPGIAGLSEGVKYVIQRGADKIGSHDASLINRAADGLEAIGGVRVFHGSEQAGVLSFVPEGRDVNSFAEKLSHHGISVRSGLHCAPLAHESAGTLETGTVRISFSDFSTESETDYFLNAAESVLKH